MGFALKKILKWMLVIVGFLVGTFFVGLVLPVRPAGTEGWSVEQLAAIVTRDCLIGVALPKPGVTTNVVSAVHHAAEPLTSHSTGK